MARSDKIRHPKKRAFLAALAETGNITRAAELSGVDRSTHYDWLASDESGDYAAAVADAEQQAADRMETEARRRAVEGWDEPVYQGGEHVGTVRKYSDTLLIFLLKGARPEKYRERFEHTGKGGGPLQVEHTLDLSGLSDQELAILERALERAEQPSAG